MSARPSSSMMAREIKAMRVDSQIPEKRQVIKDVQQVMEQFQARGIVLDEAALHQAAAVCLYGRHYEGVVCYVLKAAEVGRRPSPCSSLVGFKLLLSAYAELVDVEGIRSVISIGLTSSFRESSAFLRQLKLARMMIRSKIEHGNLARNQLLEAQHLLDRSIDQVKGIRQEFAREQETLEDEVMRNHEASCRQHGCYSRI